ncbi:MAG: hypothetical protein HDT43_00915 [Ruminococcaceae bacterium]|nr:hypothetical protein [Oscillospiraceae bacterium]
MTVVECDMTKCVHYRNGACTRASIELGCGECMDFEHDDYTEGADYQTEYFKACSDGTNKWRERSHGKRLIIDGVEFFTEDDDRDDDRFVRITHGRTGAGKSSIEFTRKHWEEMLKVTAELPDVTTLPLKEDKQ